MGQDLEDEEIFDLIATVDADGSGQIDFPEFLTVILNQKAATAGQDDESDTVDAFIALGGNDDKTGQVSTDKLRGIIKDFGLTIDIERLIRETDLDHSGFIDYDIPRFCELGARIAEEAGEQRRAVRGWALAAREWDRLGREDACEAALERAKRLTTSN